MSKGGVSGWMFRLIVQVYDGIGHFSRNKTVASAERKSWRLKMVGTVVAWFITSIYDV
jgi:hypothetical protein